MFDNSIKENDTLTTLLEKKKTDYEHQMMRNEELAGQNLEHMSELKIKVSIT